MSQRTPLFTLFLALITYSQHVAPLLELRCVECHTPSRSLDLTRFPFASDMTEDQTEIVNLMLMKAGGPKPKMPPGNRPKLTAAQLNLIQQWRDGGLAP